LPQAFVILATGSEIEVDRPANSSLVAAAALAALLVVAGCGIKGPLELPEGTNVAEKDAKGRFESSPRARLPGYQLSDREKKQLRQLGKPQQPDQPFVLDPLLN
jgi:predicted small lipoprotein YifL